MKNLINEVTTNGWGTITTFKTEIGTFDVTRRDHLDINGNPIYLIVPVGYIKDELPKLSGYRRNNKKGYYSTQSYNIEENMKYFLNKLNEQIEKGNKLYVNN